MLLAPLKPQNKQIYLQNFCHHLNHLNLFLYYFLFLIIIFVSFTYLPRIELSYQLVNPKSVKVIFSFLCVLCLSIFLGCFLYKCYLEPATVQNYVNSLKGQNNFFICNFLFCIIHTGYVYGYKTVDIIIVKLLFSVFRSHTHVILTCLDVYIILCFRSRCAILKLKIISVSKSVVIYTLAVQCSFSNFSTAICCVIVSIHANVKSFLLYNYLRCAAVGNRNSLGLESKSIKYLLFYNCTQYTNTTFFIAKAQSHHCNLCSILLISLTCIYDAHCTFFLFLLIILMVINYCIHNE